MANPVADGRMINRAIADSDKFASLTPEAAVLFTLLIPWFNAHGKLNGGPGHIKDEICPKISYLTYENIPALLTEISSKTNVKWFKSGGRFWIHALKFNSEHQKLEKKLGVDRLPSYNSEQVADKPQTSSQPVADKSVLKDKDKDKKKAKEVSDSSGKPQPVDHSQPPAFLKKKTEQKDEFLLKLQRVMEKTTEKYNSTQGRQEIVNFVKSNINSRHPEAILHCINSLVVNPGEIKSITQYLNAALKIEDGKYNARDSERICNELKLTTPGIMSLGEILGEIRAHAGESN